MQYVPGGDLGSLLSRDGPMELAEALTILGQIGDALDYAHARGLIHRDVKPGNVIVATDRGAGPYAYLTDFGLSKNPDQDSVALTKQGHFVGTTAYTAPEEILAQPRDHRVDIYSMGCVLFEMLVGDPPFVRSQALDVMYAHIGDPRPQVSDRRPGLPHGIDAVIAKAMAVSPDDRHSSCGEFIAAASALLPEGSVREVATLTSPSTVRPPRRSRRRARTRHGRARRTDELASRSTVSEEGSQRVASCWWRTSSRLAARPRWTVHSPTITASHVATRRVHRDAEGFVVEDQHSANGTFVDGVRIEGAHPLRPGDELRIGSTVFDVASADRKPVRIAGALGAGRGALGARSRKPGS